MRTPGFSTCALMLVLTGACSDQATTAKGDAAWAGAGHDGAAAAGDHHNGGSADAAGSGPQSAPDLGGAAPNTCLDLRACVLSCRQDAACATRCRTQAPAAARQAHQAVVSCSEMECDPEDLGCRCAVECFHPSPCAELLDDCTQAQEDPFCAAHCL